MKKVSTILLIGAFVLLQANRWTAYMGCRLKSIYSVASCDCERILASTNNDPADHHEGATYAHWHPDEFFCPSKTFHVQAPVTIIKHVEEPAAKGLAGYPFSRYKPPVA